MSAFSKVRFTHSLFKVKKKKLTLKFKLKSTPEN